jgi:hypothetical protein
MWLCSNVSEFNVSLLDWLVFFKIKFSFLWNAS